MHPAKSVIAFTTLSGAGYGLLLILMLGQLTDLYQASSSTELMIHLLAFLLVSVGLLISTFHLGHPERAWRALSQWRSSWLSREGICSLFTFIPWSIYLLCRFWLDDHQQLAFYSAVLTAIMAILTVYTTSMIYRSLKAVQCWYNIYVTPLYLIFSLASGLTILNAILFLSQYPSSQINNLALVTLIAAILLKRGYWRFVDKTERRSTIESATGLGRLGKVQALEHPHSQQNYLLAEMGFQIARKHSKKLRQIFQLCWSISIISLLLVAMDLIAPLMAVIGFLTMVPGITVERWLFFAEAKHDQALFYGQ